MPTSPRLVRSPVVRIVDQGDATTLLGSDGVARRLEGDSAALVRALLAFLWSPRDRSEILAHLEELTGAPLEDAHSVDQALALLRSTGAIRDAGSASARRVEAASRRRLVVGLTGAVATMHAPTWVSQLIHRGFDVRVATTRKALRFVRTEPLEALTHRRVYSSVWQRDDGCPVPHINIAEWAEAMLIYPASATTVSRIAQGSCVDLVSAIAISTRAPVVIAPSMNPAMYSAPSVQRNLEHLRSDGFHLVHPAAGVEVAHAPDARVPVFGPAPPFEDVLAILMLVLGARPSAPRAPSNASDWDALYTGTPADLLPWARDDVDRDIAEALSEFVGPGARMLDLGAGTGTVALHAAKAGMDVVATDLSSRAIEIARSRDGADRVTWFVDDVLASHVLARFDLVHDRGCLHLLPRERHATYVRSVAARLRPGGVLVLKVHADSMRDERGTHRFTRDELGSLFEKEFDVVRIAESTLPGPREPAPPAWLAVFRRKS